MARNDSPPSFQFYPRDLLSSRAVELMSPEARGGYLLLLCHAWLSEEPGILEDDDTVLAGLSRLGGRWPACALAIRRAFRQTSREGRKVLVQDRMVLERAAQAKRFEMASKGARLTNEKRWPSVAQRPDSDSHSVRSTVTPSSASASSLESTSKAEAPRARKRRAPAPQLTLEQIAQKFSLPLAKVQANAAKISALGKYRNEYRTLINWCAADASDPNGKLPMLTSPRKIGNRWLSEDEWQCSRCKAIVTGSMENGEPICRSCLRANSFADT